MLTFIGGNYMNGVVRAIILLSLLLLPVNIPAQVSSPSSDGILERPVRQWLVDREDSLINLVTRSLATTKTPGGVIILSSVSVKSRRKLNASGLMLRDVLNAIVEAEPRYRWEITDGVINFIPVDENPALLDTVIPEFRQEDTTARTMLSALEEVPEIQRRAETLGFDDIRLRKYDGPVSSNKFSIHCRSLTLRGVLNEIVRQHGNAVWSYTEYECDGRKCLHFNLRFG
jgi:hypothetical protein